MFKTYHNGGEILLYNMIKNFSDRTLVSFLTMAYGLFESRGIDLDNEEPYEFIESSECEYLINFLGVGGDEDNRRLYNEFIYALMKLNQNNDYKTNLIRPTINTFNVIHKVREIIRKNVYYEQEVESYLKSYEFDEDYVEALEMNDEFFIYDGEITDQEEYDSNLDDSELYDINQVS